MGIPMSVDLRDEGDAEPTVRAAFELLHAADRRFSTYRDDSEIAAVNRGELAPQDYSDELWQVLAIAEQVEHSSGGAFSARLPGRPLDVNGIVKGWAVQAAADLLVVRGIRDFCFNAGGDIVVRGAPAPHGRQGWNVAVRSPWEASGHLAVLTVTDGAVATSGVYERGAHIIDGRTGRAPTAFASVTVLAPSLTTADVLATAVFALGRPGPRWAIENGADAVLAFTPDGTPLGAGPIPFAAPDGEPQGGLSSCDHLSPR